METIKSIVWSGSAQRLGSETQLSYSDIKAHTASSSLSVLHTQPSLTPQHMKGSHTDTALAVVKRVCAPVSVFIILESLFYCLCSVESVIKAPFLAHPSSEVRNDLRVGHLTTSILYHERNKESSLVFVLLGLSGCYCGWHVKGQVLSMRSPCPEPQSTNSTSPLDWGGLSREMPRRSPNTFSCSSMMSLRMSAIISRRKSKEPGGPWGGRRNWWIEGDLYVIFHWVSFWDLWGLIDLFSQKKKCKTCTIILCK